MEQAAEDKHERGAGYHTASKLELEAFLISLRVIGGLGGGIDEGGPCGFGDGDTEGVEEVAVLVAPYSMSVSDIEQQARRAHNRLHLEGVMPPHIDHDRLAASLCLITARPPSAASQTCSTMGACYLEGDEQLGKTNFLYWSLSLLPVSKWRESRWGRGKGCYIGNSQSVAAGSLQNLFSSALHSPSHPSTLFKLPTLPYSMIPGP
eukprot:3216406-Rhodomonas_salina.1